MRLVPIKISELNEADKYHVYDRDSHTYYKSRFDSKCKKFVTEQAHSYWSEKIRPKEIKAVGAEIIMEEEARKFRGCTINIVVEG